MKKEERVQAFVELGRKISSLDDEEINRMAEVAYFRNRWFTSENVRNALKGMAVFLEETSLKTWTSKYTLSPSKPLNVGVVMAGNIPLVGFHDLLCVLISGHTLHTKLSAQDSHLPKIMGQWLLEIAPEFNKYLKFCDKLKDMDATIATGSDNSARYFEYYFGKKPHIIRKNRTSVAIIDGNESLSQLRNLAKDIFSYFGLGCRNVSKLFYPAGYDITTLFPCFESYKFLQDHAKYRNNYDYNKSIYLVNKVNHFDTGFLLVKEDEELVSPISVLFTQSYQDLEVLTTTIEVSKDKIQCIASDLNGNVNFINRIPLGQTQFPKVWDYADGIDTLEFLDGLTG